ncbi:hypothetical protein MIZ03_3937 [Rhodoferax lithotrophicus]|uniref:Uncharacterized protein n=1 Tax=Rhodoferax lithotrophicus TaxID=2798804 RepID=A0ABM7MS11_9BURK|nr:hypothetical protein MIZ03_3937 [Rhodoferax sp. MIZ03]
MHQSFFKILKKVTQQLLKADSIMPLLKFQSQLLIPFKPK